MEERDVKQEELEQTSADSQESVNEEITQPQQDTTPETPQLPPEQGDSSVDDFDEGGVPWKNRAMEFKRKYEDVDKKLSALGEKLDTISSGQKQQYTPEQLEMYAQQADNPTHAQWAVQEARRLREQQQQQETASIVEKKLTEFQQRQQQETTRNQVFQQVVSRYPELVQKDPTGNVLGWNQRDPLYQRINQYMRDPELQKNPRGLRVAAALANEDLALYKGQKSQAQVDKQKQEIKNLQKKTLVEGGGSAQEVDSSPIRKAVQTATKSGEMRDATAAMTEILKARGTIK